METKYTTIPFDVNRINEEGVRVVTRGGRNVRILCTDLRGFQKIAVAVDNGTEGEYANSECVLTYYANGGFYESGESNADLMLEIPIKPRRMTNQELSWWLRDCSEEHREWRYENEDVICQDYVYVEDETNKECIKNILIRRNGGKWEEPLIEQETKSC